MKIHIFYIAFFATAFFSCTQKQAAPPPPPTPAEAPQMVGNDKDEHGCIGSAGYTWSAVSKDCIRLFETGTRLVPTKSDEATAAFIVFSADKLVCELFVPGTNVGFLLDRHAKGKSISYYQMDGRVYDVREEKGRWICEKGGEMLYAQPIK